MLNLNDSTILVTGGSGFIGSNFIELCFRKYPGIRIMNIDKMGIGSRSNIKVNPNQYKMSQLDISNPVHSCCIAESLKIFMETTRVDYVFHFAAESHVDRSINTPTQFIKNNVIATTHLLDYVLEYSPNAKVICISTDEVYGHLLTKECDPFTSESILNPRSPYSASKAASDLIALAYAETYGIDLVVTRCCNNFGEHQGNEKLIPTVLRNLFQGSEIPVYGTGENIREWIYVEDHNEAVLNVAAQMEYFDKKIWNIGSGLELSNLELIKILGETAGIDPKLKFVEDRKGHDFRYAINPCVAVDSLNFDIAIKRTVDFYRKEFV